VLEREADRARGTADSQVERAVRVRRVRAAPLRDDDALVEARQTRRATALRQVHRVYTIITTSSSSTSNDVNVYVNQILLVGLK